jgi:hypothetical protein
LKDIKKERNNDSIITNAQDKYLSRISTNTHFEDLDKFLEIKDAGNKNINNYNSPGRLKKNFMNEMNNSNINNLNFIYNKDPYQNMFKIPISSTLNQNNNAHNIHNLSNINSTLKFDSPHRNKHTNIIDKIIYENKDKFNDDGFGSFKEKGKYMFDAKNRVNENDFELFQNSENKYVPKPRKKSGLRQKEEDNTIGEFESRRKNKANEFYGDENTYKKGVNYNFNFNNNKLKY